MYQYRFVFRLPTRPRPQVQFGRILHEALKDSLGSIERDRPLTWEMVNAAYVAAWARERFCAPEQAPSLQDLGRSYLRRAFDAGDLSKPLLLEEDRQTIVRVADGIRAELFPAKPDRMKCSGCDFKLLCPSAAV